MVYFTQAQEIQLEDHPKYPGVRIAILIKASDGQGVSVSILEIAPGVEVPIHTHPDQADSIYITSGRGRAYFNGDWHEVGQGDHILAPKGEEHGLKNDGDTPMRLFVVHCPPLF